MRERDAIRQITRCEMLFVAFSSRRQNVEKVASGVVMVILRRKTVESALKAGRQSADS